MLKFDPSKELDNKQIKCLRAGIERPNQDDDMEIRNSSSNVPTFAKLIEKWSKKVKNIPDTKQAKDIRHS